MKKFIIYFGMATAFLNNNSFLTKHLEYDPNIVTVITSDGKEIDVHYSALLFSNQLIPELEFIQGLTKLFTSITIPLSEKEFETILPILKMTASSLAKILNKKIDELTMEDIRNLAIQNIHNALAAQVTKFVKKYSLGDSLNNIIITKKFSVSIITPILWRKLQLLIKKLLLNYNNNHFKQIVIHDISQFSFEEIFQLILIGFFINYTQKILKRTSLLHTSQTQLIDTLIKMLNYIYEEKHEEFIRLLKRQLSVIFSQILDSDEDQKKKLVESWNSFFYFFNKDINLHFPLLILLSQSKNPNKEKIITSLTILKNYFNFASASFFSSPHNTYSNYSYNYIMPSLFKNQQFMQWFDSIEETFKPIFRLTIGNDNIPIITESGISRVGLDFTSISKDILQLKNIEKQFQSSRLKKIFPERLARFLFSLKFDQEERRKILVGLSIGAAINAGVLLKKVIEYYHNKAKSGA